MSETFRLNRATGELEKATLREVIGGNAPPWRCWLAARLRSLALRLAPPPSMAVHNQRWKEMMEATSEKERPRPWPG